MLWSLPADGSCKSLMEDDAEIWSSFINLDVIPSGDKQPMKIKKQQHRYREFSLSSAETSTEYPNKNSNTSRNKKPAGHERRKRVASSLLNPFPIVPRALSVFLLPGPGLSTKRTLRSNDATATRTSLKKLYLRSFSLYRDYSYPNTLSNVGEPS